MKKKILCLTLLAAAAGAMLAACGPTGDSSENPGPVPPTSSSVEVPPSSSSVEVPPSSTSENTDVWATRVKITQPGIVVVGDTLKVSEIVEFTPANANKFTVVSTNEDVVTVGNDNDTLTIVGAGTAGVQIKGATNNVLGQININAMTQAGKALQEFSDGVTNNFILDAQWTDFETTWDKLDETATGSTEGLGLLVNPKYVVDGTYGAYSAISLEKDDGAAHGFTLLNGAGKEVSFANGMKNGLASAASIEIGDKVSSAYIDSYFVLDGVLEVTDYTEGDDGWFTLNDTTQAQELIGTVFGMQTTSYTGVGAKVKLENGVLVGEVKFDYQGKAACKVDFHLENNPTPFDVLENAVKNAEPPVTLDVTPLANSYAQFTNNYAMSWEVGLFDTSFNPIAGFYDYNCVGLSLYTANSFVYAYADRDATTGQLDLASAGLGGYYADQTGIYQISIDVDGTVVKDTDPLATNITSIYDQFYTANDISLALLENASLTLLGQTDTLTGYSYDATFDGMLLFSAIEGMVPLGYGFAKDPAKYAQYCQGQIIDAGTVIQQDMIERVLITTLSGYQGYHTQLMGAGQVADPIGQKVWEAFPNFFEAPAE